MEKTINLEARETQTAQQLDQERTQALAMVGALSLDMEVARKNLDAAAERQRAFIRSVVSARGIDQYENARLQGGAILVSVPDAPVPVPMAVGKPHAAERVNGPIIDAAAQE